MNFTTSPHVPIAEVGIQLLVIEPLFEEANRCRRLIATILRGLEAENVSARIAELPGTGESLMDIVDVRLDDWRSAIAAYPATYIASFRGGAIFDEASKAKHHWRFSPETGERIVRDLRRATLASAQSQLFAGHALDESFLGDLAAARPAEFDHCRTVGLASDHSSADLKLTGSALWRRAEPGEDSELAQAIVADLLDWMKQCDAS